MKRIFKRSLILFAVCFIQTSCQNEPDNPTKILNPCLSGYSGESLDIITWNAHEFPSNGDETIMRVSSEVLQIDADIVALQEVTNRDDFNKLLTMLPGYHGLIDAKSELNLAFLIKSNSSFIPGSEKIIFENNPYVFPRPPFIIAVTDKDGSQIILINIHLKCCDGAENEFRRKSALEKLKKYLDDSLSTDKVIVMGDFNDEIADDNANYIFRGFLEDTLNYRFGDFSIASGNNSDWSFPGWPSHIDHFLLSNELFIRNYSVQCLKPDVCDSSYFINVSDHRPVLFVLNSP